jgi:hypothetical protein
MAGDFNRDIDEYIKKINFTSTRYKTHANGFVDAICVRGMDILYSRMLQCDKASDHYAVFATVRLTAGV